MQPDRRIDRPWTCRLRAARALAVLVLLISGLSASAQEICDNAIDDDGDGLVDLNDSLDCSCGRLIIVDPSVTSMVPNPSFELYDSLPTEIGQLDRCVDWAQATYASTDYFHTAGYMLPNTPLPLPDGQAYTGFHVIYDNPGNGIGNADAYTEYLGVNFPQPLLAGTTYVLRAYIAGGALKYTFLDTIPDPLDLPVYTFTPPFFGPLEITIFGTSAPATFPVGTIFDCPVSVGWFEVGHASYQAETQWSVITIPFTPTTDLYAIMIGGPCKPPMDHAYHAHGNWSGSSPYYLMDDLTLNTIDQFTGVIVATGGLCAQDLVLTAHAPTNTVSHQWFRNGVALISATGPVLPVTLAMGAGRYTCVARGPDNACLAMDHEVYQETLVLHVSASPRRGCEPLDVHFACTDPLAAMVWTFGDGTTGPGLTNTHTYQYPGTYEVSFTYTTASGCVYQSPLNLPITVLPRPDIAIAVEPPGPYLPGQTITLQGTGTFAEHWSWSFGNIPPYVALSTNSTTLTLPTTAGTYDVALYATMLYNVNQSITCLDTAYLRLEVPSCNANTVFVPTAFSPDASGKNDQQCVYGDCIVHMTFRIFDRWGNKVFESFDQQTCWDGLHNGQPLDAGVYVYQLHATLATDEVVVKQGNISLIR